MPLLLYSLADELIGGIISYIQHQPHLFHLTLVSKRINAITTPHLYRDIHFKRDLYDSPINHLLPFTFLILQKPEIASLVHSFTLRGRYNQDNLLNGVTLRQRPWPADSKEVDAVLKPMIEAATYSLREKTKLSDLIRRAKNEAAVLSILLPALRKLRRLDIMVMERDYDILRLFQRAGVRQKLFGTHPYFTKLTDIMISGGGSKHATNPDIFFACCTLPAVERIYGYHLGNEEQYEVTRFMSKLQAKSSDIISIELRYSKLHPTDLSQLLASCKKLKTLIYEVGCPWIWIHVETSKIRDALKPHEEWLEELCLDHHEDFPDDDNGWNHHVLLAISFEEFKALKHLKVAPLYLFGHMDNWHLSKSRPDVDKELQTHLVGRLPESLQKLHITFCERIFLVKWLVDALEELLEQSDTCVPSLNELVLEGRFEGYKDYKYSHDELARILRVADRKGIKTIVLHNPFTNSGIERAWGMDETVEWEKCRYNERPLRTVWQVTR